MSAVPHSSGGEAVPRAVTRGTAVREALEAGGIRARLLGGIAVYLSCQSARPPSALARDYGDVDVVVAAAGPAQIAHALSGLAVEPAARFNALHGHSRMLFTYADGMHLDIFVRRFAMCHQLDLGSRLDHPGATITASDLLLTKLQIAELNKRDVYDLLALLLDQPLTEDDQGISPGYVAGLLAKDWGWWRSVTENLERLERYIGEVGLGEQAQGEIAGRLADLRAPIDAAPRSRRWRMRAAIGDRMPWRESPEEI